ncbi:hypothetical protein COU61_04485 [Candidatus Pacearchaeota archaeon CG10_big_fil_rev_8_21_14_0_10_35_13]|nr:MAG: hypothetical protein COU61_04485 [Candidatus Pacearchaeota archaeon CG10_big_fil_rev_8_21_14_0_10_35_13]
MEFTGGYEGIIAGMTNPRVDPQKAGLEYGLQGWEIDEDGMNPLKSLRVIPEFLQFYAGFMIGSGINTIAGPFHVSESNPAGYDWAKSTGGILVPRKK